MSQVTELTREKWILGALPEWGTWLNEEIDAEVVKPGTFAMWWIGCTGIWFKTENNTNIAIDLWFGNGKRTQKTKEMAPFHQMRNMTGGRLTQPNLRAAPIVFDPFAVTQVDAVLSTHYHNDHIDPFFAAAVIQNCKDDVPFIGPQESVKKWLSYGVPENRCKIVKPGDVIKIKDTEIIVVDSFDRTCIVTTDHDIRGVCPTDMDEKAVPSSLSWTDKLLTAKKFGYNFVEISIDETEEKLSRLDMSQAERMKLVNTMIVTGVPIRSMCLSGHRKFPLGSALPEVEKRSLEIMEKAIELANDLGIRIIMLAGYDVYYEESNTATKERFLLNLKKCVEMASKYGILLAFETMETPFMDTVAKAKKYVDLVNSPYLKIYPDLGNITNSSLIYKNQVIDDLETGRSDLVGIHIKETAPGKYREIPFGTGHVKFKEDLKKAWDIGVRRFVTELWCTDKKWEVELQTAVTLARNILNSF